LFALLISKFKEQFYVFSIDEVRRIERRENLPARANRKYRLF